MTNFRNPPKKDRKHLAFIRKLPCIISGTDQQIEAAHIRYQTDGGTSLKPSDFWTVPLNTMVHKKQHNIGEKSFWEGNGYTLEEVKQLARDLYAVSGDEQKARDLIREFRG